MEIDIYYMSNGSVDSVTVYGNVATTSDDGVWLIIYEEPDKENESIVLREVARFKWECIIGYAIDEIV